MTSVFKTTAMVLALGLPIAALAPCLLSAQTVTTAAPADPATAVGFLSLRAAGQMLATDLIGHDVHARRTPVDMPVNGRMMGKMRGADLAATDKVGQINDLVLDEDGTVAAIVIGIGGFLGMGEHDVAVTMDQIGFASDADAPRAFYILINTPAAMLKTSPRFDRLGMSKAVAANGTAAPLPMLKAPDMMRDGYSRAKATDMSIDLLIGKSVYGPDDIAVGEVHDVTVDTAGAVQKVIIDFGGFLDMGTTKVALGFDELTILANADTSDIRVYVDATKDQIRMLPVYTASN